MTKQQPVLSRAHIFAAVFFAIFIFLLYQGGRILAPFFSALLWAAIITLALYPLYKKVLALLRDRAWLAAAAMTLFALLLIIGPAVTALVMLATQAVDLYRWASDIIQSGGVAEVWERFKHSPMGSFIIQLPFAGPDLKESFLKGLGDVSSNMASQLGGLLKNTLLMTVNLLIMILSLFFFFRDGESYYQAVLDLLPFTPDQKESITQKFLDTFTAVINGVFLIALIQGTLTGIGFAVFGVSFPVFWGFVAAVLALLPIGGAAVVWIGGSVYLYLMGQTLPGVFLAAWGLVLVSMPDNILRPLIIGRKAKLPTFLLFIGILGGIQAYGILGILFGPVVVTLLTAFIKIYREEFAER